MQKSKKNLSKKGHGMAVFFSIILASCFLLLSVQGVDAQTASISGDELCGASSYTVCNLTHVKIIAQKLLATFVLIGGSALILFIAVRLVQSWFAYRAGNAGAIKQAGEKALQGVIGFFLVFAVLGGLLITGLSYLGTKPEFLKFLQLISGFFIEHAYAADEKLLPNPLGSNNLFDLIVAGMNLAMKFFVYPALIVMWVWSGFQMVYSQGNPEGLKKARSWFLWAFLITAITFMLQGFLLALKPTALKIAPQNPGLIQPQGGTSDGRGSPTNGAAGSSCTTESNGYGIRQTDGTCKVGGSR